MEEDIKMLENIVKIVNEGVKTSNVTIGTRYIKSIEHLINKVKSQEKQIKLMQSVNITENFVEKSKIYEKIEKINNSDENYTFEKLTSEDIRRTIITNLQELLEEE